MGCAVKVEHLCKTFRIPHERRTTLFESIAGFLRPNRYETMTVLQDIDFEVESGECIGIIGENGSGKSTLLKIIANILRPTSGSVEVSGKLTPFLELGVGFQPDLSVRENIRIYGTVMGLPRRMISDRIEDVIGFAGLERFEDTKLKNLSSGMQVRLAFSTAIQTEPDVLLVDEVLAVGDMEFQKRCFEVFDHYRKEGVTIFFVSHDLGAVRRFCNRTLLLNKEKMVCLDETNRVIEKYIYKAPAESAAPKTEENGVRRGNKRIEILEVKLLDKNGNESSDFISLDPLKVRILYNAHEKVYAPVFGLAFYWNDLYCYGTITEFEKYDISPFFGKGHVDFAIERLPVLEGKIEITAAVAGPNNKVLYDWHERLYSFEVHNQTSDLGIFHIDGRWSAGRFV